VPPSKRAQDLLREFRARKLHMALVVDEHGTCIGLVTLDDLLRELVGDTPDEGDTPERGVHEVAPGRFRVDGGLDVADFEARVHRPLPEGDWTTVAGFVLHQLGRLPQAGDSTELRLEGELLRFRVTAVEARRIEEVELEILPAPPAGDDEEVA
jgi:putative hemolysin